MTELPSIAELAALAADPTQRLEGWLPLTDVVAPLDLVVERMVESAGHCQALYRLRGPQPHALILGRRRGLGEASFIFTDRNAAWHWAETLGAEDGETMSDVYNSSVWYEPKGHEGVFELSVHEYESETSPEAWAMLQCLCPLVTAQPRTQA